MKKCARNWGVNPNVKKLAKGSGSPWRGFMIPLKSPSLPFHSALHLERVMIRPWENSLRTKTVPSRSFARCCFNSRMFWCCASFESGLVVFVSVRVLCPWFVAIGLWFLVFGLWVFGLFPFLVFWSFGLWSFGLLDFWHFEVMIFCNFDI